MNVVLDANIIISEGYGRSPLFRFFLSASRICGYKVFAPRVVTDEVVAAFGRDLDGNTKKMKTNTEALSRLLDGPVVSPTDNINHEQEVSSFQTELLSLFTKHSLNDYPNISHEELVQKATSRRRPFDAKGAGYRDALTWATIVRITRVSELKVVFLTCDQDFADKTGDLHPILQNELSERGQPRDKVLLVESLPKFLDNHVKPRFKSVLEDPEQIVTRIGIDLDDLVKTELTEIYSGATLDADDFDLPREYQDIQLSIIEDVSDVKVIDTFEVNTGEYLLNLLVESVVVLETYVHKSDAYRMHELMIYDYDWNKHYVWGTIVTPLRSHIDITVDIRDPLHPKAEMLSARTVAAGRKYAQQ